MNQAVFGTRYSGRAHLLDVGTSLEFSVVAFAQPLSSRSWLLVMHRLLLSIIEGAYLTSSRCHRGSDCSLGPSTVILVADMSH